MVVEEGETVVEPPVVRTYPMLLMYRVVALVEEYVRVEELPWLIDDGLRVTVQVGAGVGVYVMTMRPWAPLPPHVEGWLKLE